MIPISGQNANEGWHNLAIFDSNGHALEALKAYSFEPTKADNSLVAKVYNPSAVNVLIEETPILPKTVQVLLFDGTVQYRKVVWDIIPPEYLQNEGKYLIKGEVEGTDKKAEVSLFVSNKYLGIANLVYNPNFDEGLEGWKVEADSEDIIYHIGTENRFPMPDSHYFYYESSANFHLDISQTIYELDQGTYSLSVLLRGDNTTGVEVYLYAKQNDGTMSFTQIFPSDEQWKEYTLEEIEVTEKQIEIGIEIISPPIKGKISGFKLTKIGK